MLNNPFWGGGKKEPWSEEVVMKQRGLTKGPGKMEKEEGNCKDVYLQNQKGSCKVIYSVSWSASP